MTFTVTIREILDAYQNAEGNDSIPVMIHGHEFDFKYLGYLIEYLVDFEGLKPIDKVTFNEDEVVK